jgi:hypothetical protein
VYCKCHLHPCKLPWPREIDRRAQHNRSKSAETGGPPCFTVRARLQCGRCLVAGRDMVGTPIVHDLLDLRAVDHLPGLLLGLLQRLRFAAWCQCVREMTMVCIMYICEQNPTQMCKCAYAIMYVHINLKVHVCIHACMLYVFTYACTHAHIYIYTFGMYESRYKDFGLTRRKVHHARQHFHLRILSLPSTLTSGASHS